jgi:hypothetical protein
MDKKELLELIRLSYLTGTLKRCECEVGNLLENCLMPLHPDDRAVLEHLHRQIKEALSVEDIEKEYSRLSP